MRAAAADARFLTFDGRTGGVGSGGTITRSGPLIARVTRTSGSSNTGGGWVLIVPRPSRVRIVAQMRASVFLTWGPYSQGIATSDTSTTGRNIGTVWQEVTYETTFHAAGQTRFAPLVGSSLAVGDWYEITQGYALIVG